MDYVTSESGEESAPERDELRPKQRSARNAGSQMSAAAAAEKDEPLSGALEAVDESLANDELRGVEDEAALRPLCLDSDEEQIEAAVEADLLGVENPDNKEQAEDCNSYIILLIPSVLVDRSRLSIQYSVQCPMHCKHFSFYSCAQTCSFAPRIEILYYSTYYIVCHVLVKVYGSIRS